MADGPLILVYDGECEFCTRLAYWIRAAARGRIEVRPNQEPGLIERMGLSRAEVERASWAVEAGGRRFEGAAGINRALGELGGAWAVLSSLYRVPPLRWAEDRYYARVARRRAWW